VEIDLFMAEGSMAGKVAQSFLMKAIKYNNGVL
jgi:hypothetical protein